MLRSLSISKVIISIDNDLLPQYLQSNCVHQKSLPPCVPRLIQLINGTDISYSNLNVILIV